MRLTISIHALRAFVDAAMTANLVYYRVRREIFDLLSHALVSEAPRAGEVRIRYEQFMAIRTYLQARNDAITNDSRLAFDKVLQELGELVYPLEGVAAYALAVGEQDHE